MIYHVMLQEHFPHLYSRDHRYRCVDPRCGWGVDYGAYPSLVNLVIHLNDSHGWDRDQIADWLDTLDADLSFKVPEEDPF